VVPELRKLGLGLKIVVRLGSNIFGCWHHHASFIFSSADIYSMSTALFVFSAYQSISSDIGKGRRNKQDDSHPRSREGKQCKSETLLPVPLLEIKIKNFQRIVP
jgi:hypothetical protein